jgi:hypothetical protein
MIARENKYQPVKTQQQQQQPNRWDSHSLLLAFGSDQRPPLVIDRLSAQLAQHTVSTMRFTSIALCSLPRRKRVVGERLETHRTALKFLISALPHRPRSSPSHTIRVKNYSDSSIPELAYQYYCPHSRRAKSSYRLRPLSSAVVGICLRSPCPSSISESNDGSCGCERNDGGSWVLRCTGSGSGSGSGKWKGSGNAAPRSSTDCRFPSEHRFFHVAYYPSVCLP